MAKPLRRTLLTGTGALLLVASLVAAGRLLASGLQPPPTTWPTAAPPTTALPVTRISLGAPVDDVAVSRAGVWVLQGGTISRVDPATNRVTGTLAQPRLAPSQWVVGVAAGGGGVWASVAGQRVLQLDPTSGRIVARVAVATPARVAVGSAGRVWAVCCQGGGPKGAGWLVRLVTGSGEISGRVRLLGQPDAVGVGASGVWIRGPGAVWRVDPDRLRVLATVRVPGGLGARPGSVAVTAGGVWVSDPGRGTVWRIDPATNQVDLPMIEALRADGAGLAVTGDGTVWTTNGTRLLGVQHGAIRYGPTLAVGRINAIAAGGDALWVGSPTGLVRVDLATLP